MKNNGIKEFWIDATSSHRESELASFEEKAWEISCLLEVLGGHNKPVIDLGTGAGEIASFLEKMIPLRRAVEYSPRLASLARKRLSVPVEEGDAFQMLANVAESVWISSGALGQYGTPDEILGAIRDFVDNPCAELFIFFDVVDPVKYRLWQSGVNRYDLFPQGKLKKIIRVLQSLLAGWSQRWMFISDPMGYAYPPKYWLTLAQSLGVKCRLFSSWFSEYRYHVVFFKHEQGEE